MSRQVSVIGLPGHNKGKVFDPREGYVERPSRGVPDKYCDCGAVAWRWFSWCGYICEKCHATKGVPKELRRDITPNTCVGRTVAAWGCSV